jgi:hypothetical protein
MGLKLAAANARLETSIHEGAPSMHIQVNG